MSWWTFLRFRLEFMAPRCVYLFLTTFSGTHASKCAKPSEKTETVTYLYLVEIDPGGAQIGDDRLERAASKRPLTVSKLTMGQKHGASLPRYAIARSGTIRSYLPLGY